MGPHYFEKWTINKEGSPYCLTFHAVLGHVLAIS